MLPPPENTTSTLPSSSDLLDTIHKTIRQYNLLSPGSTVLVAVSGGPDSVCLLSMLSRLREEFSLTLVAAHLNHGFRGREAEEDAAYVATLCQTLEIPCRVEVQDVPGKRKRQHLSAQEAARNARHAFLRRTAEDVGAERIALGHTRDDRIESVLLNIVRGTGLHGLTGFPPVNFPLIRPLYDVSRAETQTYCEQHNLQPRIDSSNTNLDYARNRMRTELLPYLMSYYNQRVGDALLRLASLAGEDDILLEALAVQAHSTVAKMWSAENVVLRRDELNTLPLPLSRRVLRQAITQVRGNLLNISAAFVDGILEASVTGREWGQTLPGEGNVSVKVGPKSVSLMRPKPAQSAIGWHSVLAVPGRTELATGAVVEAAVCANLAEARAWLSGFDTEIDDTKAPLTGHWLVFIPLSIVTLPLEIRSRRPGDAIVLDRVGTVRIQDLLTNAKVAALDRNYVPILADGGGTGRIWSVAGLRNAAGIVSREQIRAINATEPNGDEPLLAICFRFREKHVDLK